MKHLNENAKDKKEAPDIYWQQDQRILVLSAQQENDLSNRMKTKQTKAWSSLKKKTLHFLWNHNISGIKNLLL